MVRMSCGFAKGGIEGGLISSVESLGVDGGYGFFDFGQEVFAGGGKCGQDVGGGDALDADVVGVGPGAGGCVGFDLEVDACEGFFVDGVEEFDGYEDLVAGFGGFEEDDGFEVVTESDAAAVEVDDLGHGAVGVGTELKPDARAGEVVAVERFGDFDDAAIPDGVGGGFGARLLEWPCGVVEGGGFTVGDVTGVEAPLTYGEGVEELERVEFGDGGGREVFLLADGRKGLS